MIHGMDAGVHSLLSANPNDFSVLGGFSIIAPRGGVADA
jgi:hypothetical protein